MDSSKKAHNEFDMERLVEVRQASRGCNFRSKVLMMTAAIVVSLVGFSKAYATDVAKKVDSEDTVWSELEKTCESNWSKFEQDISILRKKLARDLASLERKQYSKLEEEDDPKITFMSATWPADLQELDEFWKTHKECATMHWEVRKALASSAVGKVKREEAVTRWEGCLLTHFSKKKLLPPVDRLVSCYKKRAAAPN